MATLFGKNKDKRRKKKTKKGKKREEKLEIKVDFLNFGTGFYSKM